MNKKRRLRRLWYVRKRNIKYYRILLCVTTALLFFSLLWCYTLSNLFPQGLNKYEEKLEQDIRLIVEKDRGTFLQKSGENIGTVLGKNGGTVLNLSVDNMKLNKLSSSIEEDLKSKFLSDVDRRFTPVKVPVILFFDKEINLGGARVTHVETGYINRFEENGGRGKRVNIILEVTVTYEYLLGENSRKYEFNLMDAMLE